MADSVTVPVWLLRKCQLLSRNQATFTELDLAGNFEIGDDLAVAVSMFLRDNTTLQELVLSNCGIHDDGAKTVFDNIAANVCIKKLAIDFNYCSSPSMVVLAKSLSFNSSLLELDLENNELSDAGAEALVCGLCGNSTLRVLNLGTNDIGTVGASALALFLKQSQSLNEILLHDNLLNDDGAALIINALATNTQSALEILSLASNLIQVEGAKHIGEFLALTQIKELYLYENFIGNDGATELAKGIAIGRVVCALELLHLEGCGIGNSGAKALGDMLKSAKQKIEKLFLQSNRIESDGAVGLSEGIVHNSGSLRCLDLSSNRLRGDGAEALGKALKYMRTGNLSHLHVQDNAIGDDGAVALADGIETNTCGVKYLDLGENEIGDVGATAFTSPLSSKTQCLNELLLYGNSIGPLGGIAIAKGLEGNNGSLHTISLSHNHIGALAAEAFGLSLFSATQKLKELILHENNIGEEGAKLMVNALVTCERCCLEVLDISHNRIGNSGCAAFGRIFASKGIPLLNTLYLNSNDVDGNGVAALLESEQRHEETSLVVNISHNHICDELHKIAHIFKTNLTIKGLDLGQCLCSEEGKEYLVRHGLQHNYYLESLNLGEIKNDAVAKEKDFYLCLNKAGRRLLKTRAPAGIWALLLSKIRADHDMLYYFIREKPDLCCYLSD